MIYAHASFISTKLVTDVVIMLQYTQASSEMGTNIWLFECLDEVISWNSLTLCKLLIKVQRFWCCHTIDTLSIKNLSYFKRASITNLLHESTITLTSCTEKNSASQQQFLQTSWLVVQVSCGQWNRQWNSCLFQHGISWTENSKTMQNNAHATYFNRAKFYT